VLPISSDLSRILFRLTGVDFHWAAGIDGDDDGDGDDEDGDDEDDDGEDNDEEEDEEDEDGGVESCGAEVVLLFLGVVCVLLLPGCSGAGVGEPAVVPCAAELLLLRLCSAEESVTFSWSTDTRRPLLLPSL